MSCYCFPQNNSEDTRSRNNQKPYSDIVKENKDYELYYKTQGIIDENDWQKFMSCLKEPLPSAFRLTSYCKSQTIAMRTILESEEFNRLIGNKSNENNVLQCIEWYPNRFAWMSNVSRVEIRKSDSYRILQNFLISETDSVMVWIKFELNKG